MGFRVAAKAPTLARGFAGGAFLGGSDLIVRPASLLKPKPTGELPFGQIFSDHMLTVRWTARGGWEPPVVEPFRHLSLHPASLCVNHGQAVFEGMKVFHGEDGRTRFFRPDLNMRRLERSAARMGFPAVGGDGFLECLKAWVKVDKEWVPSARGSCFYIRPVLIECGPVIGTFAPLECLLYAFGSPSGNYFGLSGVRPIDMLLDETHVRAAPGGVGWCKHAGNYAPTFVPAMEARARGCMQVLFTAGGYVGECAAMNTFFLPEDGEGLEFLTPPLDDGTILPGVTRQSVLELARAGALEAFLPAGKTMRVSERPLLVTELKEAAAGGRIVEIFGTGTAVGVQPVRTLVMADGGRVSTKSTALGEGTLSTLWDIQYARVPHEWSVPADA